VTRNRSVLVSVILISGILVAFVISISVSARSHALFARNSMSDVLAKGIADGMARLVTLEMSSAGDTSGRDGHWDSYR
jgi:hypothetical protein